MKLMVLAGTEDGRKLAALLQERGHEILVSTLTEYGAEIAHGQGLKARSGALSELELKTILQEQEITALIDATHPYAQNIRVLAQKVARETGIPYFRWERPQGQYPEHPLIHFVPDLETAAALAGRLGKRIFLSTGSRNLPQWLSLPELKDCEIFVRVLPTAAVLQQCEELGLKPAQITAMQGPFSQQFNEALWQQLKIEVVISKESGAIGGTDEKVQACLNLDIPIIILERPQEESTSGQARSGESGNPDDSLLNNSQLNNSELKGLFQDFIRKVEE